MRRARSWCWEQDFYVQLAKRKELAGLLRAKRKELARLKEKTRLEVVALKRAEDRRKAPRKGAPMPSPVKARRKTNGVRSPRRTA